MNVVAIDPGDVHVGVAEFAGGQCVRAFEMAPDDVPAYVRGALEVMGGAPAPGALVIEEFRLYPWKAQQQAFSQMLTAELIGQIRLVWRWWGDPLGVQLVLQPASIKKPTKAILAAKKVVSEAKRSRAGGHAADAELHGYHYLMRLVHS